MIYTHIPYAPSDKKLDLGWAYNNFMERIGIDDWACFLDHDAMFTTRDWYVQLESIVKQNGDSGCFTAMTNRVGNPMQLPDYDFENWGKAADRKTFHLEKLSSEYSNHDIKLHRTIGKQLFEKHGLQVSNLSLEFPMSGVLILVSKRTWKKVRFANGFLGVDNQFHTDCVLQGLPVYLMNGVYVYHWYRGDNDISHLGHSANPS